MRGARRQARMRAVRELVDDVALALDAKKYLTASSPPPKVTTVDKDVSEQDPQVLVYQSEPAHIAEWFNRGWD